MPRERARKEMQEKQPKAAAKEKVVDKDDEEPRHLKRISLEFLADVAAASQLPTNDVRKVLQSLRNVLLHQVRVEKTTRIPNVCMLRLKTLKAHPAGKKFLFGEEREVKAKAERKKILCTTLKSFQIDSCA